jgi:hypothetical protein
MVLRDQRKSNFLGPSSRVVANCQTGIFLAVLSAGLLFRPAISLAGDVQITAFSATPGAEFSGNEAIYSSFTANHAEISMDTGGNPSYVTCPVSDQFCAGDAADFFLTITGTSPSVPIYLTFDGLLDGSAQVSGGVLLEASTDGSVTFLPVDPFSISPPNFYLSLYSGNISVDGTAALAGFLSLTLSQGQTVTLPNSFDFYVDTAPPSPEPATAGLLAIGAASVALARRKILGNLARR